MKLIPAPLKRALLRESKNLPNAIPNLEAIEQSHLPRYSIHLPMTAVL